MHGSPGPLFWLSFLVCPFWFGSFLANLQAAEFGAVIVDFQSMFDNACELAPAEYWGPDGVHPSHAGHMLMSKTWLAAVTGA